MENLASGRGGTNRERENNLFDKFKSKQYGDQDGKEAIEYFLSKLKRVDNELVVSGAELREINEEILRKNVQIDRLKMKLDNLIRDEASREIKRLEQMKIELKENVKKADRVLAGLGLIWVGENSSVPSTALGVRFIADGQGPGYRPDQGYREIRHDETKVTPFTGRGYRLGTGSEIFIQQAGSYEDQKMLGCDPPTQERQTKTNFRGTATTSMGGGNKKTSSDHRIRPVPNPAKTDSFDQLPTELRLMSESERRRTLKQVSVQVQKNMNKYTI